MLILLYVCSQKLCVNVDVYTSQQFCVNIVVFV